MIEFRALSALGKRKTTHMCIVWQQDLADDEVVDMKLPIWRPKSGSDFHRLRQNYHDFRNEEEGGEVGRGESGLFACEDAVQVRAGEGSYEV